MHSSRPISKALRSLLRWGESSSLGAKGCVEAGSSSSPKESFFFSLFSRCHAGAVPGSCMYRFGGCHALTVPAKPCLLPPHLLLPIFSSPGPGGRGRCPQGGGGLLSCICSPFLGRCGCPDGAFPCSLEFFDLRVNLPKEPKTPPSAHQPSAKARSFSHHHPDQRWHRSHSYLPFAPRRLPVVPTLS